ncbi:MAG TPA: lipopolysaccharide biosynthesis protein [Burkholderiaceae bacterium]|nr:lipopolysaccharide biosynthesis protein [Burkholderiaceae bacterium]
MSTPSASPALDHALASGIAWTAALRWLAQLISWVATLYAARLLAPADYGLIAMATLAIGLARMVEDFGLDAVLVQDRSIDAEQRARLAGFLLLIAVALAAAYLLLAPAIAGFFGEPQVAAIIMALSALMLTDALQVVPRAQLQRELQFGRLALATFVQALVTAAVLAGAATAGLGYWALVLNSLAGAAAITLLLVLWRPFAIAWPRDVRTLARPLLQGWRLLAARIAWYGYTNADQTIVGRMLGKDALGAYSFAVTFSTLAQQEIGSVISRVVPGVFSAVQDRREELRRYFLLLTELLTVFTFPVSIGTALVADLAIPLVLGPQWDAVVVPLQLLCVYAAYLSSQTLMGHLLLWTGQFRANLWLSVLAGVGMPLALLGAVNFGLVGIGWAWVVVYPVLNIPQFYLAFRTVRVTTRDWLRAVGPALAGCAAMALAVFAARAVVPDGWPIAKTGAAIAVGALVYAAVIWFGFRARVHAMFDLARALRTRT